MKKILIILGIFLLTGCYDYVELNDLTFVSSVGIDYKDDEFVLTLELLNDTKQGDNKTNKAYTVKGSGKTISQAFDNTALKVNKIPYYYHLKAMILSENVAKNYVKDIIDYILRSTEIRKDFYLVVACDVAPHEILSIQNEVNPVVGNLISEMIKTNERENNITYKMPFEDALEKFINPKIDAALSSFSLSKDVLVNSGIAIFDNYKMKTILDNENSALFVLLTEEKNNFLLTKKYEGKVISMDVFFNKSKYDVNKNLVTISLETEAQVKENNTNMNFKEEATYKKLDKDFTLILEEKLNDFLTTLKEYDADILGLQNMYYKKTKKDVSSYLKDVSVKFDVNFIVSKKGLIFGVDYE